MSSIIVHSRDVAHAKQTRRKPFVRRRDREEYARWFEEAGRFLDSMRLRRLAQKIGGQH